MLHLNDVNNNTDQGNSCNCGQVMRTSIKTATTQTTATSTPRASSRTSITTPHDATNPEFKGFQISHGSPFVNLEAGPLEAKNTAQKEAQNEAQHEARHKAQNEAQNEAKNEANPNPREANPWRTNHREERAQPTKLKQHSSKN